MKKQSRRFLAFLTAFAMLGGTGITQMSAFSSVPITASAADLYTEGTYEEFTYRNYGDHVEITECDHAAAELVIPAAIDGVPVTKFCTDSSYAGALSDIVLVDLKRTKLAVEKLSIPASVTEIFLPGCRSLSEIVVAEDNPALTMYKGALYSKDLTTLVQYPAGREATTCLMPDGLTTIAPHAFANCTTLYFLDLPESVREIGDFAFCSSKLTSIKLPASLAKLGDCAFYSCSSLEEIALPAGLTAIGPYTFAECRSLTSISLPEGITSISRNAFYTSGLESITFPDSLTEIGALAFGNCENLTAVHIPANVTLLDTQAFSGSFSNNNIGLQEITVDPSNTVYADIDGVLFDKSLTILLDYPSNYSETDYTIPEGTKAIASGAFSYSWILESVTIPESVTAIEAGAFYGCDSLVSAAILGNVKAIEEETFFSCSSLRRLVLPDSVTAVAQNAFYDCANVMALYYMGTEEQWNTVSIATEGNSALTDSVKYFGSTYSPEEIAPIEGTYGDLVYLNYGDHVEIIGCNSDAAEVIIPGTIDDLMVTAICDGAFQNCPNLTAAAIPTNVTSIGSTAFSGTSLQKVYCEGDCYEWEYWGGDYPDTFYSNTTIYPNYYYCESTDEYTTGLQNGIAYKKYSDHIEIYQLDYYASELVIPAEIEELPVTAVIDSAFCNKGLVGGRWFNDALQELTIPESVTELSCITTCYGLSNLIIAEGNPAYSVIDGNILMNQAQTEFLFYPACRGQSTYTIPDGVTAIGDYAFAACDSLQEIHIPEGVVSIGDGAFFACTGLTEIDLPESLTALDGNAFTRCYALTSLTIPDGVTELSNAGFFFCTDLKTLFVPETMTVFSAPVSGFGDHGITDIYYGGTQAQWTALTAGDEEYYEKITVHCNFVGFSAANLNGDGEINATDAAFLLRAAAAMGAGGERILTKEQEDLADVNGDGAFDAADAALILQYAAYTGTGGTLTIQNYIASL